MTKKKDIIVKLIHEPNMPIAHRFEIDMPGKNPHTTNTQRYTTRRSARRGALRLLSAYRNSWQERAPWFAKTKLGVRPVVFHNYTDEWMKPAKTKKR